MNLNPQSVHPVTGRTPIYSRGEHIADMAVHAIGIVAALLGVPVLITLAAVWHDGAFIAAVAIYGASLLLMLSMSASYNFHVVRREGGLLLDWLRRGDHAAIYVKIAGTYTPFAILEGGEAGFRLLLIVWTVALLGLLQKLLLPNRFERISVVFYLALGWVFVVAGWPVTEHLSTATLVLMLVGGGLYSLGVLFHLFRNLPYQNAIWHVFVLAASFVFYSAVLVEVATAG